MRHFLTALALIASPATAEECAFFDADDVSQKVEILAHEGTVFVHGGGTAVPCDIVDNTSDPAVWQVDCGNGPKPMAIGPLMAGDENDPVARMIWFLGYEWQYRCYEPT